MTDSSLTDILLWAVLPYVMVGIFVTGVAWRYRYDQFGWTTRSSELYESRLLRDRQPAVPLRSGVRRRRPRPRPDHPRRVDRRARSDRDAVPLRGLRPRRPRRLLHPRGDRDPAVPQTHQGPVFMATTRNDKMMYLVLVATICAGLWTTVAANSLHQATTTARPSGPGSAACSSCSGDSPDRIGATHVPGARFDRHRAVHPVAFHPTRPCLQRAGEIPLRPYIVYRSRDVGGAPRTETPGRGWDVGATRPPRTPRQVRKTRA